MLGFKLNVMERNATVSFGPTIEIDTFLATKQNYGFGEGNGDLNAIYFPINFITDNDLLDNNATKSSVV